MPDGCFGALFSLPTSSGAITDWTKAIASVHNVDGLAVVATDLLACVLTGRPAQLGADIAIGSAQRFGVPMGFGGPHAAFIAADESVARALPGRLVGVSTDTEGRPAMRLALQTREQHIRREKATSQHLHRAGAAGQHRRLLRGVARARGSAADRRADPPADVDGGRRSARRRGSTLVNDTWFDTLQVHVSTRDAVLARGRRRPASTCAWSTT